MMDVQKMQLHPKTLDEAIEWWDDGKPLFSIELGGLGPGYEQCIQVTGMEIIREFSGREIDWDGDDKYFKELNKAIDKHLFGNPVIKKLGLSGAQASAAKNMASVFMKNGWEGGINMAPKDRHIQISKGFPA